MPSVRLDRLRKQFGDVVAVDDVSVEFRDGEMTSVLGPSGCGKTTTLNLIAGFIEPDGGSIHFGGQLIADARHGIVVPPNKRNLGMVFQSYALWPHLSVADNVAYGLKMHKVPRPQRGDVEAVKRALQRVRLEPFIDRFPHELSGGQQQRVALARAIAYSPQILLFDEPLSNLDAQLREEMRLELKDIRREIGITAVYVTHDQAEAMSLSDRIAVDGARDKSSKSARPASSMTRRATCGWRGSGRERILFDVAMVVGKGAPDRLQSRRSGSRGPSDRCCGAGYRRRRCPARADRCRVRREAGSRCGRPASRRRGSPAMSAPRSTSAMSRRFMSRSTSGRASRSSR